MNEKRRGSSEAQRWISVLVGVGVLFICGWMTYEATNPRPLIKKENEAGVASSSSSSSSAGGGSEGGGPVIAIDDSTPRDLDSGLFLPSISLGDAAAGTLMAGAPRHVKMGVVLVNFQGAEGAPTSARGKREALTIAERLAQEAKTDFHKAVTGGDSGSSDDIGRIPRGVLDPRTEGAVFALSAGEVSDVLETPKGFWIVKRIE
jgi:hypothetical protein